VSRAVGFNDPIVDANERKDDGGFEGARKIPMALCQADLRRSLLANRVAPGVSGRPSIAGQELLPNYDIPSAGGVIGWGLIELLSCILLIPKVPTPEFF